MFNKLMANLSNLFSSEDKPYIRAEEDKAKSREEALENFLHVLEIKRQWKEKEYIEVNSTFCHYQFTINNKDFVYGIVTINDILDSNLYSTDRLYQLLCLDDKDVEYIKNEEFWTLDQNFNYVSGMGYKSQGEGWFDIYRKSEEGSSLHKAVYNSMKLGRNELFNTMINSEDFKKLKRKYEMQHKVADF